MSTPEEFIPPSIEEIAALLPAYEIKSFIAKGGMGAVYMASQKSLDRVVAIKILPRKFGEDESFRSSFEQEAKSMAKFNHPNLVSIYDFGQIDGMLYFIMEMVQGKPLYYSCYGKKIDPTESNRIIVEVCNGLDHAHKHGILHRDIKPANILLDPNITPKIGDFGLARGVEDHASDQAYGTPGYTAPEVVNNPQAVAECTDVYSVGIMLYELLTSEIPKTPYIPVTSVIQCDARYDDVILKAINPNPALRYQRAEEMGEALLSIIKSPPTQNSPFANGASASAPQLRTPGAAAAANTLPHEATDTQNPSLRRATNSTGTQAGAIANAQLASNSNTFTKKIVIVAILAAAIVAAWQGFKITQNDGNADAAPKAHTPEETTFSIGNDSTEKASEESDTVDNHAEVDVPEVEKSKHRGSPTALRSLEKNKEALIQGKRSKLPKGTITKDGRSRLFIKKAMSWHDAKDYAESYGAHLAVLPTAEDLAAIISDLEADETIWLGAGSSGHNQWRWVDGTAWTHQVRKSSILSYITLNSYGILAPAEPRQKHSFYIEWLDDGTQPALANNQLKRAAQSLDSATPEYPTGTVSFDDKHYFLYSANLTWNEASQLANTSGGQLAVPSTSSENQWLLSFISNKMQAGESCWLGGISQKGQRWKWQSGETWKYSRWNSATLQSSKSSTYACAINDQKSWISYNAEQTLPYVLIEWSDDHLNAR